MAPLREDARLRRFEHPEADVVWAAIEALSEPLKHEVLRELATAVAIDSASPRTPATKVRKAVAALRQAFDLLGHSPSVKDYRQLCKLLPELGLPPESNVRAWLASGWDDSLKRALLPVTSDGDFSEIPKGSAFEKGEVHAAVIECAADLGRRPFFSEYRAWARRCNDEGRPGRRPLSHRAFEPFGGYLEVLVATGVMTGEQAARDALDRVIPASHEYTESDCLAAIHEVKAYLSLDRAPRTSEYMRARREIQEKSLADGRPRTLPTTTTITKGRTWDDALIAAGLEPLGGKATMSNPRRRRPSYDDEQCAAALRQAWAEIGDPFTAEAYSAWRKVSIERLLADGGASPHIPSTATIAERFGGWPRACAQAIPGYEIDPKKLQPFHGRKGRPRGEG